MEEAIIVDRADQDLIDLPPGFRFFPTDEEIITHYLTPKVMNSNFTATAISQVDLNRCEPWDMPKRAKMGEKEWYFFCQRDRKYPTGMRTNRATEAGYWKATGKDKEIYKGKGGRNLVGMKKTLVFYRGRAPKGEKSNWVMHEYRLEGKFSYYNLPRSTKEEWVVCRVFHKSTGLKKTSIHDLLRVNSFGDDFFDCSSLPPLTDPTYCTGLTGPSSSSFNRDVDSNEQHKIEFPNLNTSTTRPATPRLPDSTNYFSNNQNQNQLFSFQDSFEFPDNYFTNSSRLGCDNDHRIFKGSSGLMEMLPCKVEQFSSNNQSSMVSMSQDTGLSNDVNNTAEISSVPPEIGSNYKAFEEFDGDPLISGGSISVMDCLNWDC